MSNEYGDIVVAEETTYTGSSGSSDKDTQNEHTAGPEMQGSRTSAQTEKKTGVAPFVLGILSLLVPYFGLVLAILALVMGKNAKAANPPDSSEYKLANVGWILGIIGVCVQSVAVAAVVISAIFLTSLVGWGMSLLPFWFIHR